jgi:hypothetical protein
MRAMSVAGHCCGIDETSACKWKSVPELSHGTGAGEVQFLPNRNASAHRGHFHQATRCSELNARLAVAIAGALGNTLVPIKEGVPS